MSIATLPEPKTKSLEEAIRANPDALYEVGHGQYVELPPMSALAAILASDLHALLYAHVLNHGLGWCVCEAIFIVDADIDVRRRPDVAFVSKERWPLDKPIPETGDWLVVPDLAVEVISP